MIRAMTTALAMLYALAASPSAAAQPPPKPSPSVQQSLKVQVVLSRYQGEKKISSLPYTLTVTTNGATRSAKLPISTAAANQSTNQRTRSHRPEMSFASSRTKTPGESASSDPTFPTHTNLGIQPK